MEIQRIGSLRQSRQKILRVAVIDGTPAQAMAGHLISVNINLNDVFASAELFPAGTGLASIQTATDCHQQIRPPNR